MNLKLGFPRQWFLREDKNRPVFKIGQVKKGTWNKIHITVLFFLNNKLKSSIVLAVNLHVVLYIIIKFYVFLSYLVIKTKY